MTVETRSAITVTVTVILSLLLIWRLAPRRQVFGAALAGGGAVALFNVAGLLLADHFDWWHLRGAWQWGPVPLAMQFGWILVGAAFCVFYERLTRGRLGGWRLALAALLAAPVGVAIDAGHRAAGVLTLGENMSIAGTAPYWFLCTLLTVGVFKLVRGVGGTTGGGALRRSAEARASPRP